MKKRTIFKEDDDFMVIDGHDVRIANYVNGDKTLGVEASHGYRKRVKTPWGAIEVATIMTVPSMHGEKEQYAHVHRPASNKGVAFSTFRLTD